MKKIIFINALLLPILFPATIFFDFGFRVFLPANVIDTRIGDALWNTLMFWPIIAILIVLSLISAFAVLKEKRWGIYLYSVLSLLLVAISSIFLIIFTTQLSTLPIPSDDISRGITQDAWNLAISKSITTQIVLLMINSLVAILGFIYLVIKKRPSETNRESVEY